MQSPSVVLLQSNIHTANSLAQALSPSFPQIHRTESVDELRSYATKYSPKVLLVDMERASVSDIQDLSHSFPAARIICNHHAADEKMWASVLGAGADDCWPSSEIRDLVNAAQGNPPLIHTAAA